MRISLVWMLGLVSTSCSPHGGALVDMSAPPSATARPTSTPSMTQSAADSSPEKSMSPNRESPPEVASPTSNLPTCTGCLTKSVEFRFGNITRTFHLYIPSAKPTTAVTVLHGNGDSADTIAGLTSFNSPLETWMDIGKRENIMLVIPNGTLGSEGKRGWNDCRSDAIGNPTTDDIGFLLELAKAISKQYGISKHFATGMSNGGHMALRLATEGPEVFSAVGIVSAAVAVNNHCVPKNKPVSVLIMRGTADPISPFLGGTMAGNRGLVRSMDDSLKTFLSWNNITTTGSDTALPNINTTDNSTVVKTSYSVSNAGTRVEGYTISGGGHAEPSTTRFYGPLLKAVVGEQNRDLECAEVVWNFFKGL